MRLIDADKLKRKCQKVATEAWKMKIKASAEVIMNQFIDFIDEAEPVDAVPVRCKDCLHNRACEIQYHAQAGDLFFCGAAERKDGDDGQI